MKIMLQTPDTKRLSNKESPRSDAWISNRRRSKIDFMDTLGEGGVGNSMY